MTLEDSRERRSYPTPPPDAAHSTPTDGTTDGDLELHNTTGELDSASQNGRTIDSHSPHDLDGSDSSGSSSAAESKPSNAGSVDGGEKVRKLSPSRLGEFLSDTPAIFDRQISSSSKSGSSTASTADGGTTSTPLQQLSTAKPLSNRTLSMPPVLWSRGQRSGKTSPGKLDIPGSPPSSSGNAGAPVEARRTVMSAMGLQMTEDTPRTAEDDARIRGQQTPFGSPGPSTAAFPPLPFHSYLSLALSNTPGPGGTSGSSAGEPFTPRQAEANVYGPSPHHPDNSAALAMERLQNLVKIPSRVEGAIVFGMFACLDSWLYIFTILPIRFLKGIGILVSFWRECIWDYFHYDGNKLRKHRRRSSASMHNPGSAPEETKKKAPKKASDLLPSHKADIMRGLMLFMTVWALMRLDASKVYHSIRASNGMKLYIIYNMLDFGDKLCAALGQDIFECLFSDTSLERRPDGRSKIWRPFGFLLLGMAYNILHSFVLFYQVIALNVAVNSYSNALITVLLSVQFAEIKSSVFKRLDKENLFQMTCADIVERFQLWLMLVIIAGRNMVEMGVWTLSSSGSPGSALPKSFTFFPSWTGQLMGPFFMVLGSEMLVDWVKHAYITKFNNIRPVVYERYLDIQCKDYYSNAFSFQNLTKRFGLPVLPLACVFIRFTIQTYHQFLATHVPSTFPPSTATSLTPTSTPDSSSSLDAILSRALSRHSSETSWTDDLISMATMCTFLLACFLIFLAVKLILGVLLLGFARRRYRGIKQRERMNCAVGGRYKGAHGVVDVGKDERKRIWEGDEKGLKACEGRERKGRDAEMKTEMDGLEKVIRYDMSSKRIW